MSFDTTADERLDETRALVAQAVDKLSEIVVGRCDGHDEYNEQKRTEIKDAFDTLLNMREIL